MYILWLLRMAKRLVHSAAWDAEIDELRKWRGFSRFCTKKAVNHLAI